MSYVLLQPGMGSIAPGHYLPATPQTVLWGRLPCAADAAVLSIDSGDTVTIDTLSHEGLLEDQGRDPLAFFGGHGVAADDVLADAVALAAAIALLGARYGMDQTLAYAYLSAATDFNISQVVDRVTGVHARIRTADFGA